MRTVRFPRRIPWKLTFLGCGGLVFLAVVTWFQPVVYGGDAVDDQYLDQPLDVDPNESTKEGWVVLPNNVTIHVGNARNHHNFSYLINPQDRCHDFANQTSDLNLLILIESSPRNWDRRQAIRDTWCLGALQQALNFRIVFLLGLTEIVTDELRLTAERYRYGDIVQENFVDTFRNLTLKTIMGLKWATTYCRNAHYVMKTDDDIFIHIPNLIAVLKNVPSPPPKNFLLCHMNPVRRILRKNMLRDIPRSHAKYVDSQLPGEYFPPYCAGLGYVISIESAWTLFQAAIKTPYFFIEDAFLTGFCRQKVGISILDHSAFALKPPITPRQGSCAFRDGRITSQELSWMAMRELWDEMNTSGYFCPRILGFVKRHNQKSQQFDYRRIQDV